ncbi:MAG TPA: hypothetical protein VL484_04305 [Vicinamibacterales bacterium]|jgi:hypothetical protein|nr:hypothetical protein [Vicinamibacterales bacterium]
MRTEHQLNTFDLIMLAGTRVMLGAGIGLLAAGRLSPEQRLAVGRTLVAIGAVTTVPIALRVFGSHRRPELASSGV